MGKTGCFKCEESRKKPQDVQLLALALVLASESGVPGALSQDGILRH